jgi:hypothetical protein
MLAGYTHLSASPVHFEDQHAQRLVKTAA